MYFSLNLFLREDYLWKLLKLKKNLGRFFNYQYAFLFKLL